MLTQSPTIRLVVIPLSACSLNSEASGVSSLQEEQLHVASGRNTNRGGFSEEAPRPSASSTPLVALPSHTEQLFAVLRISHDNNKAQKAKLKREVGG